MKTLHLDIYGDVQGVGYRDSMCREALRTSVTGWVRNCDDGTVEALLQGSAEAVDAMVRWVHRGPRNARVDRVDVQAGEGHFEDFVIRSRVSRS
jgi:acylphosphatase